MRFRVRRLLMAGLLVLTPVSLTGFVLWQLFTWVDGIFAPAVKGVLGVHVPGLGVVVTAALVLLLGALSTNVLGRRLLLVVDTVVHRVPLARTVYSATKGVVDSLARRQADAFKRVVLVEYPREGIFSLGFVTGSARWEEVDERTADVVMVFLPTTPNPTSGFLLVVPRDQIRDLAVSVEEGIRMVISGGLLLPRGPVVAPGASAAGASPAPLPTDLPPAA
jgi:uncharacterized membrane protein